MNLKHFILQTMTKLSNCTCHFHQTVSPSAPGPFNIDTTITDEQTSHEINLGSFRSSCDFSSDNNIIVSNNQEVKGSSGMTVESVKVTEIRRSGGNAYQGVLTVGFKGRGLVRAIRPIEVDVILTVDSSAGVDDTERPIKLCGAESSSADDLKHVYKHYQEVGTTENGGYSRGDTKEGDAFGTYVKCPEGYIAIGSHKQDKHSFWHEHSAYKEEGQTVILRDGRVLCRSWWLINNSRKHGASRICSAICAPIGSPH